MCEMAHAPPIMNTHVRAHTKKNLKISQKTGKMAWQIRALVTAPDELNYPSSLPETHMVEGERTLTGNPSVLPRHTYLALTMNGMGYSVKNGLFLLILTPALLRAGFPKCFVS